MMKALRALSQRVSQLDETNPILHGPLNKNEETKQLEHMPTGSRLALCLKIFE